MILIKNPFAPLKSYLVRSLDLRDWMKIVHWVREKVCTCVRVYTHAQC